MPFDSKGQWIPESADVGAQVAKLTSADNPYITQARTAGLESSNRRGLLNSSMAAGAAQGAAIAAAAPLASQTAQQISQNNLSSQQAGYDMDRQRLVTSSADKNASLSAALETNKAYLAAFSDLANNKDIPAATRDTYLKHLLDTRSTGFDMVQQTYGIKLDWGQGQPSISTAAPGSYTPIAEVMPTGLSKDQQAEWRAQQAAIASRNQQAYG